MGLKSGRLRSSLRQVIEALPSYYDVTITSTNSPIEPGQTLNVNYDVNNTGDQRDTQDILLEIDNTQEDSEPITLNGSELLSSQLNWATESGEAGDYTASVISDDDVSSTTVTVESAIPDSGVGSITNRWPMDEGSGTSLRDSEGSQPATLNNGGTWDSNSKYTGGTAPTFADSSEWWITDNKFGINNSQFSVCGWVIIDYWDNYDVIVDAATSNNNTSTDSPWRFRESGGNGFRLSTDSGGEITSTYWSPTIGADYFIAIAGDGNNFDSYIWDSSSQVYNQSGSASRTASNEYLRGFGMDNNGTSGVFDDWMTDTTSVLTESEFETIWQNTQR